MSARGRRQTNSDRAPRVYKVLKIGLVCGLMLAIGLMWVARAYLDARDREYVQRLVGALNFFEGTIEASGERDADLYAPSIEPRPEPGHWVLSGIMVTRDSVEGQLTNKAGPAPFSAILETVCSDTVDPTCWQLERLAVDGDAVTISELAGSNHTSTPEGGSRENAIANSIPKEPSTPTLAETAATQAVAASPALGNASVPVQEREAAATLAMVASPALESASVPVQEREAAATLAMVASPPLESAIVPLQESLQCVEQGAWGDPDIGRNRQVIIDEAICLRTIEFAENGLEWRVQVLDSGRPGINWVVLHDDENTAFDASLYAIVRYGGKVVDVDLRPTTLPDAIVDPNHNFAATDDQRQTCGDPVRQAAPVFTSTIIEELGAPPYLALHNNYDGHLRSGGSGNISVRHSAQGLFGLPAYDAVERLADEDNFIIVSGLTPPVGLADRMRQLTDELRNSGINVIYEHVREDSYDCSLSNYLLLHGGAEPGQYFNIEAEIGDYQSQITMIDALVGMLLNPPRASR